MSQRSDIIKYLQDHIGLLVNVDDISKDLDIPKASASSQTAWVARKVLELEKPSLGVYRYKGEIKNQDGWEYKPRGAGYLTLPKTTKKSIRLFEEIGMSKGGRVMVRDEGGSLYWLVEMD